MNHNFENLEIWQLSRELVKEIYLATQSFPSEEKFGLTSQIRKAAVSVPSNIAEGCGRGTDIQLKYFLEIAIGSLCEVETQLYLAWDLDFLVEEHFTKLLQATILIRRKTLSFKRQLSSRK